MSLGHMPQFVLHRDRIAADAAGVPSTKTLKCRGYEKVLVHFVSNATTPGTGGCDLEAYVHDAESDTWLTLWTQATATEGTPYEADIYGGDVRIAARAFTGTGVTWVKVYVGGARPERTFGN